VDLKERDAGGAVVSRQDAHAALVEDELDDFADGLLVVDEQDGAGRRRRQIGRRRISEARRAAAGDAGRRTLPKGGHVAGRGGSPAGHRTAGTENMGWSGGTGGMRLRLSARGAATGRTDPPADEDGQREGHCQRY